MSLAITDIVLMELAEEMIAYVPEFFRDKWDMSAELVKGREQIVSLLTRLKAAEAYAEADVALRDLLGVSDFGAHGGFPEWERRLSAAKVRAPLSPAHRRGLARAAAIRARGAKEGG